ncbi:hypothetical protein N0V88_003169 [Collariella sp. IMI 366227]|nr:hypothetical protein N0V88_003169 [Collariella sp. IMI 366227]
MDYSRRASMVSPSTSSTTTPTEFTAGSKRAPFAKSDIRVNLADHYTSKVYTSGSPIAGNVTITTKRDVRFDQIQIVLLGHTKTVFEGMNVPQEVTHTFLKMLMPIPESTYPVPRVLESGETYTIPFNFVIPHQLTINACNHALLSEQMQDQHVLLPPSMGGWQRDDMAPKMAQVEYSIKARVLREDVVGGRKTRIMEGAQNIQVLPASAEEPPLNITANDKLYRMSKSKTIRKNLLSARLGRLTAEATQPGAAILSADGRRVMSHPMARIKLTFTPESASSTVIPPTVTAVSTKVTSHTYFSSGTISSFPNLGVWNEPYIVDRRAPLSKKKKTSSSSSSSSSPKLSNPTPSQQPSQSPLLPTSKKTFLPTFHSCILSRVYTAHLTLSLAGSSSSTLSLTVPLQVAVEGASPSPYQYDGLGAARVMEDEAGQGYQGYQEQQEQQEQQQAVSWQVASWQAVQEVPAVGAGMCCRGMGV